MLSQTSLFEPKKPVPAQEEAPANKEAAAKDQEAAAKDQEAVIGDPEAESSLQVSKDNRNTIKSLSLPRT